MGNLGSLLTTALAVVAIATLAGFGLMRGDRSSLRERIDDYEKEVAEKDRRLAECEGMSTAKDATIAGLRNEVSTLRSLKSGETLAAAINVKLDEIIRVVKDRGSP